MQTTCQECGSQDGRPFQVETRSKANPYRRLDLCKGCRRKFPKAYRIYSSDRIEAIPAAGFTSHKRTVDHKNYLVTVHANGRAIVFGQYVSTRKYASAAVTVAEALAVLELVGPQDPRLILDKAY